MEYIIDFNFSNKKENILDLIVRKTRQEVEKELKIDIKKHGLTNKCDYVRNILAKNLDEEKIDYDFIETNQILGNDVVGHSFLVSYLEKNSYIMDLTYMQFFDKDNCKKNNYQQIDGITIKAPLPGYYYITNLNDIDIAKNILENGYIKLDERSAKVYLDSFYLTRRGRRLDIDIKASTYLNAFDSVKRKNKCKK